MIDLGNVLVVFTMFFIGVGLIGLAVANFMGLGAVFIVVFLVFVAGLLKYSDNCPEE